jgi:subtilisin family serine protease
MYRQGVTVYVVDDGVDISHPDFEGRAKFGWTAISKEKHGPGGGHGKSPTNISIAFDHVIPLKTQIAHHWIYRNSCLGYHCW